MQIIKTHQQTSARRNLQESGFCSLFPQTISLEWTKFSSSRCIPKETLRIITPDKGESNKKCLHRAFGKNDKAKRTCLELAKGGKNNKRIHHFICCHSHRKAEEEKYVFEL